MDMKAKEIKELISFIADSGLEEVNIETEEFKIKVKRNLDVKVTNTVSAAPVVPTTTLSAAPVVAAPVANTTEEKPAAAPSDKKYVSIKSPMIGTFYRATSPDVPPLVNIGDTIQKGKVVCIVEAMKLFNEIESEISGKIVKVLVDNASPVEYDQELFLVEVA